MSAILTVQEVAERMRCEHRTVRRAIKSPRRGSTPHLEVAAPGVGSRTSAST